MITVKVPDSELKKFNREIKKVAKKLDDKTLKKAFRKGSKPFVNAAKAKAPAARRDVHRYSTAKMSSARRAPKGMGAIRATYTPGNLGRSMRVLPMRRLKRSVLIGPRRMRRPGGVFAGRRVDGWYAHFVEFGTKHSRKRPFVQPAWEGSKAAVMSKIRLELKKQINGI